MSSEDMLQVRIIRIGPLRLNENNQMGLDLARSIPKGADDIPHEKVPRIQAHSHHKKIDNSTKLL